MAIDNFIPEIWAARLLENLRKAHVAANLCNRDYEGDIRRAGDVVHINSFSPITVGTYTKNTDMAAAQTLTGAQTSLAIDQQKYFNFQIDSIDRAQQIPKIMDAAMRDAAYGLRDVADQYILGLYTGAPAANMIGTDTAPATTYTVATEAYNNLVKLATILDENNVPDESRWVVAPPWFLSLLLLDDRFVKLEVDAAGELEMRNLIGYAAGFRVYKSNNIPTATGTGSTTLYHVIAGYDQSITFAEQIVDVQSYVPELRFADAVKGLHVYGAKLVRPATLAVHTVARPTALI